MNPKLYHLSPKKNLTILDPELPAEDVINCRLMWADNGLPSTSKCVCFAEDLDQNFHCNPIIKGYIYEPKTEEISRSIFTEIPEDPSEKDWCDFSLTKEHRYYKPVPVKMVGEFELKPTPQGLRPHVKWYKEKGANG